MLRGIIILFFAISLFVGSAGIHVFEHFCKIDGTDYSFFIPPSHACKQAKKIKSCCEGKAKENTSSYSKNCCEEDLFSFKITSNFIQKDFQHQILIATVPIYKKFIFDGTYSIKKELICDYPTNRPPPKKGQEILILNQVFRI